MEIVNRTTRPASGSKAPASLALGFAVRTIRKRLGMTQVAFSKSILNRQNTLSQIEAGIFMPGVPKLLRLLRMAATDNERRPILGALEARGIIQSDLTPELRVPPQEDPNWSSALGQGPAGMSMNSVSAEADQAAGEVLL